MFDAFITTSSPFVRFCTKTRNLMVKSDAFKGRFPWEVQIESASTGRVVRFVPVEPGDTDFDQDQWDGEMCIYKTAPGEEEVRCRRMIVYHG